MLLDLLKSLSLESGALVVALASAGLSVVAARLRVPGARWTVAGTVPLLLAYSLYWLPVWLGDSPMEYRVWAPLFIVPWYMAGVAASLMVMFVIRLGSVEHCIASQRRYGPRLQGDGSSEARHAT